MTAKKPNKGIKPHPRRKEDIIRLRAEGKSMRAIAKTLGCSKSTVSYHCSSGGGEKKRVKSQRKKPLCKKVNMFKSRCTVRGWTKLRGKVKGFKKRIKGEKNRSHWRVNNLSENFNCAQVVEKIGENPRCYLTGREIDLNKPKDYNLDHIVPITLGGTNDLSNLGICSAKANHAKAGLSLEDFYSLCEEILAWRDKQENDGK